MENKLVKLLSQFYALDHRGKFQFCKESEEACSWVNASSTREIDCRICIQEALDQVPPQPRNPASMRGQDWSELIYIGMV